MMLTAVEAFFFSISFYWTFSSRKYSSKLQQPSLSRNFLQAAIDVLNPSDIIKGILTAIQGGPLRLQHHNNFNGFSAIEPGYHGQMPGPEEVRPLNYVSRDPSIDAMLHS